MHGAGRRQSVPGRCRGSKRDGPAYEMVPLPLSRGSTTTVCRESAAVMGSWLSCRNIPHLRGPEKP